MSRTFDADYDVAIIGAGINGAGIAREAALRGLSVIILEKNDMCSGTSAVSSRLVHGGLRYLEYGEIPLVYESLHERRYLRVIANHLVKPLRISIPVFAGARRGKFLIRLGMIAYDILSFNKRLPRHEMLSREEVLTEEPGLRKTGLVGAARYFDAQVVYAERLVLENLLAAKKAGADIRTGCRVTAMSVGDRAVDAIEYVDAEGKERRVRVASVVNAAGPWVDKVLATAPLPTKRFIGGTKGSHIVVAPFAGAPADAFYVEAAQDGRPFFIIPWNEQYLIGTTDIRYNDSLDKIRASLGEVDYLIEETNRIFPEANISRDSVHFAYAGVRPLPHRDKGPESAITRRHLIKVNRKIANNLISIIGGKLTTYRNLAEQTVDRLARVLRRRLPASRTRELELPGAWGVERARSTLAEQKAVSEKDAAYLLSVYGGRAIGIASLIESGMTPLEAEVRFTIREEFPRTLSDIVFRRMMTGFTADQDRGRYDEIATIATDEFAWTSQQRDAQLAELIDYADSLRIA